jgi:hypothetical protein
VSESAPQVQSQPLPESDQASEVWSDSPRGDSGMHVVAKRMANRLGETVRTTGAIMQRVNRILLAGAARQFVSIMLLAVAAIDL